MEMNLVQKKRRKIKKRSFWLWRDIDLYYNVQQAALKVPADVSVPVVNLGKRVLADVLN